MKLFKFFSLFPLVLSTIIFAEAEYVAFKIYGDRVVYVNEALCNPDNLFGKDIKIAPSVPIVGGMQVNVWQCMQLCAIVKYLTGIRSSQIKDIMPAPLQLLLFPSTDTGENPDLSGFITKSNDPENGPTYVVDLHTRLRFALSGGSASDAIGISFSNSGGTGFNMHVDTTATLSSLSIWAMKCAENSFVGYIAKKDGYDAEMYRFGYKVVELLTSIACKCELRPFFPDFFRTSLPDNSKENSEQFSSYSANTASLQSSSTMPTPVLPVTFNPQTLKAQIEAQDGCLKDILELEEEQKKDQSRRAVIQEETEEDQEELISGDGSMPFSSIPDADIADPKSKSDLAEYVQSSGSVIPQMAERRKSSGYAGDDKSSFPHSKPTDQDNQDW